MKKAALILMLALPVMCYSQFPNLKKDKTKEDPGESPTQTSEPTQKEKVKNPTKYAEITLTEDANPAVLRSIEIKEKIANNCTFLSYETGWSPDLSTNNKGQCDLYMNYITFSEKNLNWIDNVEISSEKDAVTGMEVEVVTFYKDGKQTEPNDFLSNQISECKGQDKKTAVKGCINHFAGMAKEMGGMAKAGFDVASSSAGLTKTLKDDLKTQIDALKSSRSPSDISKVKDLKNSLSSVEKSAENTSIVMPNLAKLIENDMKKLNAISNTLKKLEKGL